MSSEVFFDDVRWRSDSRASVSSPRRSSLPRCRLLAAPLGPNYVRPTADVPVSYKELGNWKPAQPSDEVAKGKWWEIYEDPQLNSLEAQIDVSNQNLKAAEDSSPRRARRFEGYAVGFLPDCDGRRLGFGESDFEKPAAFKSGASTTRFPDYTISVDASWEPDLWGRVRRTVEASRSEAQATAADVANVSLSLQAELAMDYFQFRGLDAQKHLLDSTVVSYERALQLTQSRYKGGLATAVDVAQAQTQLRPHARSRSTSAWIAPRLKMRLRY